MRSDGIYLPTAPLADGEVSPRQVGTTGWGSYAPMFVLVGWYHALGMISTPCC
jgi:hypothetical protein